MLLSIGRPWAPQSNHRGCAQMHFIATLIKGPQNASFWLLRNSEVNLKLSSNNCGLHTCVHIFTGLEFPFYLYFPLLRLYIFWILIPLYDLDGNPLKSFFCSKSENEICWLWFNLLTFLWARDTWTRKPKIIVDLENQYSSLCLSMISPQICPDLRN